MKRILLDKRFIKVITLLLIIFMLIGLPLFQWIRSKYIGVAFMADTSLFYSSNHFNKMIESYGPSGRKLDLILRWTFDLIYPLVYSIFFLTILVYLRDKIKRVSKYLLYLPLIALIMDLIENTLVSLLLIQFPKTREGLVYILQVFTGLKWFSILVIMILIIRYWIIYNKDKLKSLK